MLPRLLLACWFAGISGPALAAEALSLDAARGTRSTATRAPQPAIKLEQGEIAGAKFTIAIPARWNRRLLLLAHGHRAESAPLVADLFAGHAAYKALLDEGWMLAKTSYRRNGVIIGDAIADLDALRAHIAARHGVPGRVLLEGDSMGGLIVTLMAERRSENSADGKAFYAGAVAVGAALGLRETNMAIGLVLQPRMPLIFLTNQGELDGPANYVSSPLPPEAGLVHPVLFKVSRDGHVNVNQAERLYALRALNHWLDAGRDKLPAPVKGERFVDVTRIPIPGPSQVEPQADGRGFATRVTEVSSIYGNVQLNAQATDFVAAQIKPFTWFQLQVGEKKYRVRYARDFEDVKRGEWVAFPNADGFTWLARGFANAAVAAGVEVGDKVTARRFDDQPTP